MFHVNTSASHKHTHRHTRDSQDWLHCVAISLVKHLAGTTGKAEKSKACVSLDSVRKKIDWFYVIICINAM